MALRGQHQSLFLVFLFLFSSVAQGYVYSAGASGFGGRVLTSGASNIVQMEMKRGKKTKEKNKIRQMQQTQQPKPDMVLRVEPSKDGIPIFRLFARNTGVQNKVWFPLTAFKGDDQSKSLCESYQKGGILSGLAKKQIDNGVSATLFREQKKLVEGLREAYPNFKKSRADNIEFGYELVFKDLNKEQSQIFAVQPKEIKGFFDNVKSIFS